MSFTRGRLESEINGKDSEDIFEVVWAKIEKAYERQKEKGDQMSEFERMILLRSIDSHWTDHIDTMDQLRQVFTCVHMHNKTLFAIIKTKAMNCLIL